MEKILLGSHVSMSKDKEYLIGSTQEMINQKANTFMIFTGPPQNTKRTPINNLGVEKMNQLLIQNRIEAKNLVVHAPYIINIANQFDEEKWKFGVNFLISEVKRSEEMGINLVVLHPGFSLGGDLKVSLNKIVEALNQATNETKTAIITLETMSGKKNEVGSTFEELAYILEKVEQPNRIGICLDTCHVHDAGYDLNNWKQFKLKFDNEIGLHKIKVIHLNDSQNHLGSHKDRHENLGYGKIGFENLARIAWDEDFKDVPKILETPLKKTKSAHHEEIKSLHNRTFINFLEVN